MSVDEFRTVIERIGHYTNYIYLHVKGEPLLHPQLGEILKICQDADMTVNLTTNATLIKEKLPVLLEYPVHQINVSLHSADDNDCIDMDSYIHNLFESCETLLDKTDTEISLRLWNTKKEPFLFGEKNCTIKRHLYINVQSPFEWPDVNSTYCNERGFCQGLRQHMAILCDGTVVPCCLDGNGVMALGNILDSTLEEILQAHEALHLWKDSRKRLRSNRSVCIAALRKDLLTKCNDTFEQIGHFIIFSGE